MQMLYKLIMRLLSVLITEGALRSYMCVLYSRIFLNINNKNMLMSATEWVGGGVAVRTPDEGAGAWISAPIPEC